MTSIERKGSIAYSMYNNKRRAFQKYNNMIAYVNTPVESRNQKTEEYLHREIKKYIVASEYEVSSFMGGKDSLDYERLLKLTIYLLELKYLGFLYNTEEVAERKHAIRIFFHEHIKFQELKLCEKIIDCIHELEGDTFWTTESIYFNGLIKKNGGIEYGHNKY